jgi:hypothetical protein
MVAADINQRRKACQPIAGNAAAGLEIGLGPLLDGLTGEACNAAELEVAGVAFGVERNRCEDGHLVFRAASHLAPGTLAAEVGIVHLHAAAELVHGIACSHGMHDLVMQHPGLG